MFGNLLIKYTKPSVLDPKGLPALEQLWTKLIKGVIKAISMTETRLESKRYKGSKAMYDALVTGYSNVCRGAASPLSPSWRLEDHAEAFGNDADLMDDFKGVIECEKQWREERMDEDDLVFRKLVLERKERFRKPQKK
ncbi:hypothetical protein MMC18_006862 [Xylographa bjoerkii]|nr:hypothetical protein [Xylographa bjoerkii]